jgi:glucose-6-phosphate 1-dehydrogenase
MTEKPTSIILFGITGDLAQKKILPALYDLYLTERLPQHTRIIGFSRRPFSEKDIQEFVGNILPKEYDKNFLELITYVQGEFDDEQAYSRLGEHLHMLDEKYMDGCSNKLFYLSVPPALYENIATQISASGLSTPCLPRRSSAKAGDDRDSYARILVEKPFGSDFNSAEKLDELFGSLFAEEQIFRIDHYLAKDALRTMLERRRNDESLGKRWNNEHIEKVEINLFETGRIGSRGAFYDSIGALRDVGQNHMLQMLALVAMDISDQPQPTEIQSARARVLNALVPFEHSTHYIRGQYDGYLAEPGVAEHSTTETFFSLTAYVNIPEFFEVPFVLTAGKALDRNVTEVIIGFKDGTREVFNVPPADSLPAYQKILLDCISGDQTVFTSTAEVMAEWKFISPIVEKWRDTKPIVYQKGINPLKIGSLKII